MIVGTEHRGYTVGIARDDGSRAVARGLSVDGRIRVGKKRQANGKCYGNKGARITFLGDIPEATV